MTAPFDIWSGNTVRLRSVSSEDFDAFIRESRDTEAMRLGDELYLPTHPESLKSRLAKVPDPDSHKGWLAIETVHDDSLVGWININNLATQRFSYAQYGLTIFRDHWRKGFGSEAIKLVLRYYFRELRINYVMVGIWSFNEASMELHRNLGFKEEGRYREIWYSNGEFHDEVHFGMLRREFDEMGLANVLPSPR